VEVLKTAGRSPFHRNTTGETGGCLFF